MLDLGISGCKAIVCASSRGLGRACATSLSRAGAIVVVNGTTHDSATTAAEAIHAETGNEVVAVAADVSTPVGQEALMAACPDADILVNNNAGPPFKPYDQLNREAILRGVEMNMVTPIEMIQRVVPGMQARKFGRIVNIASISVRMPVPGLDLSSGARAGLVSFMAGVCRTFAADGVTMNNMLPGFFDTDRYRQGLHATAKLQNITPEALQEARIQTVPARRIGDPAEFGDVCAFLCSRSAGYINGQNILLDGGQFPSAF